MLIKRFAKTMLTLTGAALLALPLGIVLTLLTYPFWNFIETRLGIESVGHSGPADWCYALMISAVFGLLALMGLYGRKSG